MTSKRLVMIGALCAAVLIWYRWDDIKATFSSMPLIGGGNG